MKPLTSLDYSRRIDRVLRHIGEHVVGQQGEASLDLNALDLNALAEIAALSPYHFHRIYAGMLGETIGETMRRLRLHHAAAALVEGSDAIDRIAGKAGYGSVAAFGRAFQSAYGMAPAAYRKRGYLVADYPDPATLQPRSEPEMFPVTIKDTKPIRLAALPHRGHYLEIGPVFGRLYAWAGPRGLMGPTTRGIGIYYSDTHAVPAPEWRSDACISVGPEVTGDGEVRVIDLAGGRHVVLTHRGPYAELHKAYNWLFGTWLPQSGEEPADRPCFEEYLNNPQEVPPEEWLTEISLPLVAK